MNKTITKQQKQPALRIQDKFTITRKEMADALIEREGEIDISLTALICGENPLLVGPPGTGKSFLIDTLMRWMGQETEVFSILFNAFTTPEEVFGPVSVMGLKNDQYRRITKGKLPEARGAFLDEIFKAKSSILNTMLRILNEKVYENGDGVFKPVPLIIAAAASNEWPSDQDGGKELGALFDRFLIRKSVRYIATKKGKDRLLWSGSNHKPILSTSISPSEISTAQILAEGLAYSETAKEGFMEILEALDKEGIKPGDRRCYKAIKAVKAYAYLNGVSAEDGEVEREHLEILAHILWDDPQEQAQKCGKIVAKIANPTGHRLTELMMQTEDIKNKFGHNENEAIPKLKEVLVEMQRLPRSNHNGSKIEDGVDYVKAEIKVMMRKVVGE